MLVLVWAGCVALGAQDVILAQKEHLIDIPIGNQANQANYYYEDEGLYSIGSPFVSFDGHVCFFRAIHGEDNFIVIDDAQLGVLQYKGNLDFARKTWSRNYNSQEGILYDLEPLAFSGKAIFQYDYRKKIGSVVGAGYRTYPAPFGAFIYSEEQKSGIAIVFDVLHPTEQFSVIDQGHLKYWLQTQPGGFTIGDEGMLYRNGMLYSAVLPDDWTKNGESVRYAGRLMSGHVLWMDKGIPGMERRIRIASPNGALELTVVIPWALDYGKTTRYNPYNYGVGPWGELYCLIAPERSIGDVSDWPPTGASSELVVVRNYLKYFGRLNDGGVRLRKDPTTTADILGTYPAKTGFRILEKGAKEETIGGQKNVWYKVRLLDGKEGWFFGSFVQNLYDGPNGKPPPWPNVPDW